MTAEEVAMIAVCIGLLLMAAAFQMGLNLGHERERAEHRPWCGCKDCVKWRQDRIAPGSERT
jgi:hypothetical protein